MAESHGITGATASSHATGSATREQLSKPRAPLAEKPGTKTERDKRMGDGGATATLAPAHPASTTNGHTNGKSNGHSTDISAALLARAGVMTKGADGPTTARSEQFADFQSDAPACDNCGAITVRTGNCYLCHNCGSSMGCS
jgi:ribonucleoside-diphosphate reductase alpha chain